MSKTAASNFTSYSDTVRGDAGNHGFAARFDVTDGYVGINQYDDGELTDRVLLSSAQVKALLVFLKVSQ